MKNKLYSLLLVLTVFVPFISFAQESLTLYNMQTIPQSMYLNPALLPLSNVNIGLPGISSVYLSGYNTGFKYSDVVRKRSDDSLYVDVNNWLSKIGRTNYLNVAAQVDLFSLSFRVKKNFFSFNVTEKMNFRLTYPKDFFNFVVLGNGAMLDQTLNFNFGANATHYRETAFGYAREMHDNLTIGGKVKLLYGYENIRTKRSDVTVYTDPQTFDITATSDILIQTSGIDSNSFDNISVNAYAMRKKNKGAAIDLGLNYQINDDFSVSASVLDVGAIKWKTDNIALQNKNANASFTFKGVDFNTFINDTISWEKATERLVDSLTGTFEIEQVRGQAYTTWLPTQFYIAGNYHLNYLNKAGVVLYNQFYDKKAHPAMSLSFTTRAGRWASASVSYSMAHKSYNNIGFGYSLNLGPLQLYTVFDNVLGVIMPQHAKNFNVRMAFNITIDRVHIDSDRDGVPDKDDPCPKEKGPIELSGCPDKDGDKVADIKDNCPEEPGLEEFSGCPDRDGDKVIDNIDMCPDVPGERDLAGCPDKDGDKIIDKNDECPDVAGLREFNGCPDKDGDKIIDSKDECPELPGTATFNGCPDTDGDGIPDKLDVCPDRPGTIPKRGCPTDRLCILDETGKLVACAEKDSSGYFVFEQLPEDMVFLYKLEGEDADYTGLKVRFGNTEARIVKNDNGTFRFKKLSQEYNTLKQLPQEDVPIVLKKEEEEILKKAFDNLEFASGKNVIKPNSFTSLDELAGLLVKKPEWRIRISGHTDNVGNPKTNLNLSKNRAEAVKKYLVSKGAKDSAILVDYFGGTQPIADNKTEAGRQKNRRVEMKIID